MKRKDVIALLLLIALLMTCFYLSGKTRFIEIGDFLMILTCIFSSIVLAYKSIKNKTYKPLQITMLIFSLVATAVSVASMFMGLLVIFIAPIG